MVYPGILNPVSESKLNTYASMIFCHNALFNLTGHKSVEDIKTNLIIQSLEPFKAINVPRGTLIADLGTGAGIPGIPLCILLENANIMMFDSTLKKIEFINKVITTLEIHNASAVCGRIEELGKEDLYREKYDWVITRAMADPFIAVELGAPLLKTGGHMYIYASEKQSNLNNKTIAHISALGMSRMTDAEMTNLFHSVCGGILLKKVSDTGLKFPRRINAIRRESEQS